MNEYYTPPSAPTPGSRARSSFIEDLIDSVDDGFDNIPAGLQSTIDDLNARWVDEIGLPTLESGKYLTNNGNTLEWDAPLPSQSGNADKVLKTNGTTASWTARLPDQSGNSGKFLTTDGSSESWDAPLPDQSTNSGKVLTTDGSTASWTARLPDQSGNSGKVLTTNGTTESWTARLPDQSGNSGKYLTTDGTDESWGSIVTSGQITGIADGDGSAGDVVSLNTDGTISASSSSSPSAGTPEAFETGAINYAAVCAISATKWVVAFQDDADSDKGKAVVVENSSGTISVGATAEFEADATTHISICYDPDNDRVIIAYAATGGEAIVGSVSGTTLTFGTAVQFEAGTTKYTSCCYDTSNDRLVIAYCDDSDSDDGKAIVGTVTTSPDTISFGTEVTFESESTYTIDCCFDTQYNKVIICWSCYDSSDTKHYLNVTIGTVSTSPDSISFTGEYNQNTQVANVRCCYDSGQNRIIVFYKDQDNSNYPTVIAIQDVSGTGLSEGTAVALSSTVSTPYGLTYNSVTGESYTSRVTASGLYSEPISVSNLTITAGAEVVASSLADNDTTAVVGGISASSDGTMLMVMQDTGGYVFLFEYDSSVYQWIGFAEDDFTDGNDVNVTVVGGTNDQQTGLTAGSTYYVDADGTITTSVTVYGEIGRALSTTEMLVTKGGYE